MDQEIVLYSYNGTLHINKKNELLVHTMAWINLKNTLLNEKSSIPTVHTASFPFIESIRRQQFSMIRKKIRTVVVPVKGGVGIYLEGA